VGAGGRNEKEKKKNNLWLDVLLSSGVWRLDLQSSMKPYVHDFTALLVQSTPRKFNQAKITSLHTSLNLRGSYALMVLWGATLWENLCSGLTFMVHGVGAFMKLHPLKSRQWWHHSLSILYICTLGIKCTLPKFTTCAFHRESPGESIVKILNLEIVERGLDPEGYRFCLLGHLFEAYGRCSSYQE
jgi:hypothetical protein